MKTRIGVYAALLVVLGVLVLVGGLSRTPEGSAYEPTRISSYDADFRVDEGGDLHVTETITVEFPGYSDRHGIFRFFDHRDPNDDFARRTPQDVSVTRGGQPEEFELLSEGDGRYTNVKIGSRLRTVRDAQVYVIRYTMDDVLLEVDGGERSAFYWDLVPSGWQMDIDRARLTVKLPADAEHVFCHVGVGERGGCTAAGEGSDTLVVETTDLDHHTPVTVSTELGMPTPEREARQLWPTSLDGVFGQSNLQALVVLLLGGVAALLGLGLARTTWEKEPALPLQYAPPEGIGPTQAAYVLHEEVPRAGFVASLMHAAEQGAVSFTRDGAGWTVETADQARVDRLDPVTRSILGNLAVAWRPFTATPNSSEGGSLLKAAVEAHESRTREWGSTAQVITVAGLGGMNGFLVLVAVVAAVVIAFANPLSASVWAIVPGLFAVFAVETTVAGASTRRTPAGRDLWSKVGGFHRVLSTPSSEARFDFAARRDLYTAYLPWAVAFGCADAWAQKYRVEVGEEPPAPSYWASDYQGVHTGTYVAQMVDSFDHAVVSAISSYEASLRPPPGSSGGGSSYRYSSSGSSSSGGFGGGGGGGGGGGSW